MGFYYIFIELIELFQNVQALGSIINFLKKGTGLILVVVSSSMALIENPNVYFLVLILFCYSVVCDNFK
jgi:hypothetical protein